MLERETADFLSSHSNGFFGNKEFYFIDGQELYGSKVGFPSVLRWKGYGLDLTLANCESFDSSYFSMLIDSFEAAARRGKNADLVADLRSWAGRYYTMPWLHRSNVSLLQRAMTHHDVSAVPEATAIWTYLFGSPAPTWLRWNGSKGGYEFDPNRWQIWLNSLNQG